MMAEWSCSEEHRDHVQLKIIQPAEHLRSQTLQLARGGHVGPQQPMREPANGSRNNQQP